MEQLNKALSDQKENNPVTEENQRVESPLLLQMRQKFGLYGGISLTFGGAFALLFYKAWIGINVFLYSIIIITLLTIIMKKLTSTLKMGTVFYFAGVLLLGVSSFFTSSDILLCFNMIGILLLLDLSLLHQFYTVSSWEFVNHFGRMIGMVFVSIACIWMPFSDSINYFKKVRVLKNDLFRNIMIGIIISLPILFITVALLSNADLLFGSVTKGIFSSILSADIFWIIFMALFGMIACYCIICASLTRVGMEDKKSFIKADASIAATVMTLLCIVYACFCVLQGLYLFTGGFFTLPEKYTFAEYARRGFFELMWVTGINISLMILCRSFFKESKYLSVLVVFMTVCTYIMIASAAYRMILYISVYHLTFLRLFVLLTLFIELFVLAGVIISQYHKNFPLFTYSVVVVSVCYIAFSIGKPDVWIASYFLNHEKTLNLGDLYFLSSELSLDAAGIILPVIGDEQRWDNQKVNSGQPDYEIDKYGIELYDSYRDLVNEYYYRIDLANQDIDMREFNYSNYKAKQKAIDYPNIVMN